ncbi:MAG: hypothetical protein ACTSRE_17115 [Promethearchaeota archaeon]
MIYKETNHITYDIVLKVILVGENAVGKQEFLDKYAEAIFKTDTKITNVVSSCFQFFYWEPVAKCRNTSLRG